ncbi:class I SAM-dependent methyltransferase [Aliiroseovarius sp. F47248L]|uniref:class I SAM-dependent methyltransferase n=1 Tax=Aliiroseovarius sp. F47248L TaxID=2926420 RepID=UPI001FF6B32D|nr:class I SAM-dependent methyltransferase [Aliiroseovarius sp. F47248L]MCK0138101.1 class I SAM-dependent methyltransferase [Aliiroseovarius sp. F47248L]
MALLRKNIWIKRWVEEQLERKQIAEPNCLMTSLYRNFPDLETIDKNGRHRLGQRVGVLKHAKKKGVGAEIGVFTGLFSEKISAVTEPETLYLVDPWRKLHGDHFPNWGQYSSNLRLSTTVAKSAADARAESFTHDCHVVEEFGAEWLAGFSEPFLDWAYLDARHQFEAVLADLRAIDQKLKPSGVIMGDDCWVRPDRKVSDVFRALQSFVGASNYQIIHLSNFGQWAITRSACLRQ